MADIRHYLRIKGDTSKVYEALTTQEGLSSWWTKDVEASAEEDSITKFGFNNRRTLFEMRIDKLVPGERVEWTCVGDGSFEEWVGTNLFFDIKQEDDDVALNFGHLNWKSADGYLPLCSYDWAGYLRSLKNYIETGQGTPYDK